MAFDGLPRHVPRMAPEKLDWIDIITRAIGGVMFLAIYVAWLWTTFAPAIRAITHQR